MSIPVFGKIRLRGAGFLALFFAGLYLLPLGIRPMMRPDEFRYGEIAREMIQSGDWIVPRLNGVRYFEKPALGHQINGCFLLLFGENAFALRLGPALAVLLTALAIWMLGARVSRDPLLPGTAVMLYLTSGLVYGVGTFAVLDSYLVCFLTLTLGCFFMAYRSNLFRTAAVWLAFAGICAGCAFLVKGFAALVLPGATAVVFLLWQKERKKLLIFPWIPLAVMALTVLPWSCAIHRAEPDFWRYFIMEEHVNRFLSHTYDRKPQPFWYFIPVLLGGIMPGGVLWFAAHRAVNREWLRKDVIRFCLCAAAVPFVFFSCASCKLGTYILPCFPFLALLTAFALRRVMRRNVRAVRKTLSRLISLWGWIWTVLAAGLLAALCIPSLAALFEGTLLPAALGLLSLAYGLWLIPAKKKRRWSVMAGGLIPLAVLISAVLPVSLFGDKMTETGLKACLKILPVAKEDFVVTGRTEMAAAAWVLKRSDLIVMGKPGEMTYGFRQYPAEYASRHFQEDSLTEFASKHPGRVVVISTQRNLRKHPFPPGGVTVRHNGMALHRPGK